jgi:hypothetical protein
MVFARSSCPRGVVARRKCRRCRRAGRTRAEPPLAPIQAWSRPRWSARRPRSTRAPGWSPWRAAPGQLGQVSDRLPLRRLRAADSHERHAEQSRLQSSPARDLTVEDSHRYKRQDREPRPPGERDLLHGGLLDSCEREPAAAGLSPHLACLRDPNCPRTSTAWWQDTLDVPTHERGTTAPEPGMDPGPFISPSASSARARSVRRPTLPARRPGRTSGT